MNLPDIEHLHPLVVHFPIALLLTAVAIEGLALILKRQALHRVALWNLCLGTLGAAVAVFTGLEAAETAKHSFEIWQVMALHQRLGIATLILGLMASGLRLFTRDRLSARVRLFAFALMLAMASTVAFGGYLGGRLVYEFGVGGP